MIYKPGSVRLSILKLIEWMAIHLGRLLPAASRNLPERQRENTPTEESLLQYVIPIWSCSRWGLPCQIHYWNCGALLPHPFTLTCIRERIIGGLLSAALSVGLRPPGVTWHSTFWSPDFPLPRSHTHITER